MDLLLKSIAAASRRCPCTAFVGTIMNRGESPHACAAGSLAARVRMRAASCGARHRRSVLAARTCCKAYCTRLSCLAHPPPAAMVDLIQEAVGQAAVEATTSSSLESSSSWDWEGEALASATTDPETASIAIAGKTKSAKARGQQAAAVCEVRCRMQGSGCQPATLHR